jgi:hypothetical protein
LEAGDGVWANMLQWLKDFQCDTVPWGYIQSNTFSTPSRTTPDNTSSGGAPINSSNPGPLAFSQWFVIDNNGDPFAEPNGVKCQAWWPGGSAFGVFAVDAWNAYQTGHICCTGTTLACGGNIVDIPVPTDALPGPIPWNRLHYVAELGLTPSNIDTVYTNQLAFGVAPNYGPNWNVNKVCFPTAFPSVNDPFNDAAYDVEP